MKLGDSPYESDFDLPVRSCFRLATNDFAFGQIIQ
jgi:hypothetical protein